MVIVGTYPLKIWEYETVHVFLLLLLAANDGIKTLSTMMSMSHICLNKMSPGDKGRRNGLTAMYLMRSLGLKKNFFHI